MVISSSIQRHLQFLLLLAGGSGLFSTVCVRGADPADAVRAGRSDAAEDTRVIAFPADRSLGRFSVRDAGATAWTELGEARGLIEVPPHREARLDIDDDAYHNMSYLTQVGPNDLQEIALYSPNLKDEDLESLAGLTGLKRLELCGQVTGRGFAGLKALRSLRELWLVRTEIDDAGLAHLTGFAALDTIYAWWNSRMSGDGFRHLGRAECLRKLDFYQTPVSDEGVTHISRISSLAELSLHYTEVTDVGLARLTGLPRLRHLVLPPKATDKALAGLKAMPSLESLDIGHTQVTDDGLICLQDMKRLKSLSIHSTLMTGEGLVHLRKVPSLTDVTLTLTMMTSTGLARMEGLPVTGLNLRETAIRDDDLVHLRDLSCLQNLSLQNTGITDEGLVHLKRLSGLRVLDLGHTGVTDEGLVHLKAMTDLRSLNLTGCPIGDAGLSHLKELGSLEELNLRSTEVSAAGVQAMREARPGCQVTSPGRPRPEPDIADLSAEEVMIGKQAPELEFERLLQAPPEARATWEGLTGKVVVLEFWATTCGPCVRALPHVNALVEGCRDRPVQFIFITYEQEAIVVDFLKRYLLKGWVALDVDRSMFESYRIGSIPCTVVVDRRGAVVQVTRPMDLTEETLGRLFEEDKQ